MKNVEVILFCYRDLVFGKILYVRPELVGKIYRSYNFFSESYHIVSNVRPMLAGKDLYLWGEWSYYNNDVIYCPYHSKKQALKRALDLIVCIQEVNRVAEKDFDTLGRLR